MTKLYITFKERWNISPNSICFMNNAQIVYDSHASLFYDKEFIQFVSNWCHDKRFIWQNALIHNYIFLNKND